MSIKHNELKNIYTQYRSIAIKVKVPIRDSFNYLFIAKSTIDNLNRQAVHIFLTLCVTGIGNSRNNIDTFVNTSAYFPSPPFASASSENFSNIDPRVSSAPHVLGGAVSIATHT